MTTLIIIFLIIIAFAIFVGVAPQFGKAPKGDHLANIKKSPQYEKNRFSNPVDIAVDMNFSNVVSSFKERLRKGIDRAPNIKLPSLPLALSGDDNTHLTWFGHSTFLYEVGNKKILFDPMLGKYASPIPGMFKRFEYDLPSVAENLPELDAIIISHDHYDHLDYRTIKALKDKTKRFVTSLGIGAHLKHWGVSEEKITELDWWSETQVDDVTITATPSQHYSGRSIRDRQKTLWSSWIIKNEKAKIFFGSDSGYFAGFKEIGEKHGPFDLTLLDSGQYHRYWNSVHMTPDEAVVAHQDLRGEVYMPIHWSAFTLSLHSWTEPINRAIKAAADNNLKITTPMIGERFNVLSDLPSQKWWQVQTVNK